ncbi:MAG TPA: NeuD/PglB/VioB family sugar acetyltransferase [Candidatus Baltobacteraceae bacterium]|nr:NeuD/PglB/VioB family sugar acetyltransferase [Candidatus Baltobacteraceae bacterium]
MNIVLWGATGQALVMGELYGRLGIPIAAVFDNDPAIISPFPGVPIYHGGDGFARWLSLRDPSVEYRALVAIGGERGEDRIAIGEGFEREGLALATALHPAAFVATDAQVGKGSAILAMAAVCARARIGPACIINTAAGVDHECVLDAGVHIAPGATLAGCVEVGRAAFIGSNATVLPRIRIGAHAIVGAGSVVTKDVPDGALVMGNPARVVERA